MNHKTLVRYLYSNTYKIERHLQPLLKEFSLGHGRIDIICRDINGTLCLIEVKVHDSELSLGERQVKTYQQQLLKFLSLIGIELSIRALVVTPNKVSDVGTKKSTPTLAISIPTEIPTSRELFGFREVK